jgi:hypothetical protein
LDTMVTSTQGTSSKNFPNPKIFLLILYELKNLGFEGTMSNL